VEEEMKKLFLERYKKLGVNLEHVKLKKSIRCNTIKTSHDDLRERLHERGIVLNKIPYAKDGFFVDKSRFAPSASIEHLQGLFYIQESASQLAVEVLDPQPGELILDMTAAPGGKTTQIAQCMKNKGTIIALDIKKMDALNNNLNRLGVENCITYEMDALKVEKLGYQFDKILLDAPCSGNIIIDKDWYGKRSLQGIDKMSELQKQLLETGIRVLKKNGILVYSTCSLEPEENELVVEWALRKLKVRLEPVNTIGSNGLTNVFGRTLDKEIKKTKRFWPSKTKTQGFFIAKFRKK
jgi:NOL1/NOP2/sun family putative RNA methylase